MLSENARHCLLGMPGAGKSHCIELLLDFFGTCLQWTDGVQFRFLATQNTMAELIGGKTLHTWGLFPRIKPLQEQKAGPQVEMETGTNSSKTHSVYGG